MRAALIPPKGYESSAFQSHYHLVLAQELGRKEYAGVYDNAENSDEFIILDNGAAEGQQVSNETLLQSAVRLAANEIVLPDVMRDTNGTLAAVESFIQEFNESDLDLSSTSMMAVVQGRTFAEAITFIDKVEKGGFAGTLGIPRHLIDTLDDPYARCRIATYIEGSFGHQRFDVHFLGTNARWPGEVKVLGQDFGWCRGIDTSMPYNYTMAGEFIGVREEERAHVERPSDYFTLTRKLDTQLLQANIDQYMDWAHGTESSAREV